VYSLKLDKKVIANSLALTTLILWIICTIIVAVFPQFSLNVTQWWMHGMDISVMGTWNLNINNFVLGGITAVASAWGSGYIFGWSWEIFSKK